MNKETLENIILSKEESECVEFKHNWFNKDELGEYISALSNAAAYLGLEYAYLIWGVDDKLFQVVGTNFNPNMTVNNEPLKHFLLRGLFPKILFSFYEFIVDNKRVVALEIAAAKISPTSYKNIRYIRIGSSKERIVKYPEYESKLFLILNKGFPKITNVESEYQELTFKKLFLFYENRGISLNKETFRKNLSLLTKDGKYNIQAQLLSDDSKIPLRVSIFLGENKSSPLLSVREFGFNNILFTLDDLLRYGDTINLIQANEKNRTLIRKEVALFDIECFNEAIINAILHNNWLSLNEPMISVFSNRIEIMSRGTIPKRQTLKGFFKGESVPVNMELSNIFMQLNISEKSGRGVPKIISTYGKEAYEFRENSIVVTIPFNYIYKKNKLGLFKDKMLNTTKNKILDIIKENPHITKNELLKILDVSDTTIDKNIAYLKKYNYIKRIGSKKTGYWDII